MKRRARHQSPATLCLQDQTTVTAIRLRLRKPGKAMMRDLILCLLTIRNRLSLIRSQNPIRISLLFQNPILSRIRYQNPIPSRNSISVTGSAMLGMQRWKRALT